MKHHRIKIRTPQTPLEPLTTPGCDKCTGRTRFVGLETVADSESTDLCTYECIVCQHVQVATVARVNGHDRDVTRKSA